MVYCGKPSRGCQNCKNRRIKCDEMRPQCMNCTRTNRQCPGFPQAVDLMFRNETPTVRRRARKAASSRSTRSAAETILFGDDEEEEDESLRGVPKFSRRQSAGVAKNQVTQHILVDYYDPIAQYRLNPTIEHQATQFFFQNFTLPSRSLDSTRGFLNVAVPLYRVAEEGSPVALATHAVAVAAIACYPGRGQLKPVATELYGKALAATQHALHKPDQQTSNATLVAILLFTLYETIVSSNSSIEAWSQHTDGAIAIVKARGLQQLQDEQSLTLFRTVRTQMLLTSVQMQKAVDDFPGPRGWLSDIEDEQSKPFKVVQIAIAVPTLLHKAHAVLSALESDETSRSVNDILQEAERIREQLHEVDHSLPAQWAFKSTAYVGSVDEGNIENVEAWFGPVHTYGDLHIASLRNNSRVNQILCCGVVIDALKWLDPKEYLGSDRYRRVCHTMRTLVDEICQSVPFHMWGQDLGERARPQGQNSRAAVGLGGYFLIWPLYTCSMIEHVPEIQRRWMLGRLRAVEKATRVQQATVLEAANRRSMARLCMNTAKGERIVFNVPTVTTQC